MMKKFTTIASILLGFTLNAQIVTDSSSPYDSADELVELIVGEGVTFSNATLSAHDYSVGHFSGNTNLDVESGLIMATRGIETAEINSNGYDLGGEGEDDDLSDLLNSIGVSNNNIHNLVVLEFDIVPVSNILSLEYVFASNEYLSYTCSNFNDVFGFFISGPGINGSYSNNAENIALVPDPNNWGEYTNTPVAINTINSGSPSGSYSSENCSDIDSNWQDYSIYYVDNQLQETVGYQGFTVPLTAMSQVEPNETYHIKLAIADVYDGAVTSAVFIQEGSLSSFLSGCMDPIACNYNPNAINDNGACVYAAEYYDCAGTCVNDTDQDGVCNELEIYGCTDVSVWNYNPQATEDDGSCGNGPAPCVLPELYSGNTGANMTVFFTPGAFDDMIELNEDAYMVAIASNNDLVVGSTSLDNIEQFAISVWGDDATTSEIEGAMMNELLAFQIVNGSNLYNVIPENTIAYLSNGVAVVSSVEYYLTCTQYNGIQGCTDVQAFNYDEEAIVDNGSCLYELNIEFNQPTSTGDFNSTYYVNIDSLIDGGLQIDNDDLVGAFYIVDGNLVAAGYASYEGMSPIEMILAGDNPETPEVEGLVEGQEIIWIVQDAETGGNVLIEKPVNQSDFQASEIVSLNLSQVSQSYVLGCLEFEACNYNAFANISDASCVYAVEGLDCNGDCLNDADMDGECDEWDYDDGLGVDELKNEKSQLVKMIDVLGKEHKTHKEGMILFYVYDNGTIKKVLK